VITETWEALQISGIRWCFCDVTRPYSCTEGRVRLFARPNT